MHFTFTLIAVDRSGSAGFGRWRNRAGRGKGSSRSLAKSIAPGERLEARHVLAGFGVIEPLPASSAGDEVAPIAIVFTTSNQVPAGGTILASPVEPTNLGQAQSFLEAVPGVARISVPASKGGIDFTLDVLDVPSETSLYKALKIPVSGLFPQDDILNRFAVSTNWYSSLEVASNYADSDWGRSQGYQVVEFAAPKDLRLIDLGDDDTLGYVWASLESDAAWTESQLARLLGADPPTTNPQAVEIVTQKLAELRRDMEIVQLTTGFNASYATQLDLLLKYGDAITNDFTYHPGAEIVRRGISPADTFIVETATTSVWQPATLVTGTTSDPVDLVTWGGTIDDLNRISFTTDIDKELTSILATYLNVDGYFATELPSLFHRDGRLIEEIGLFLPRDSTVIVPQPPPAITVPLGEIATDQLVRAGDEQIIKRGGGTLVLELANTHSGGTIVEAGEVVIRNPLALGTGSLVVQAGAKLTLEVGTRRVSLPALTVAGTGTLDLGTGSVVLAAGGYDPAELRGLIMSGRNNGAWTGSGITSRGVRGVAFREVGYRVLPDGSAIVGFSAVGDATMDGFVNVQDLIALNAAGRYEGFATNTNWFEGDFNYDGLGNINDLIALLSSGLYGKGSYLPVASAAAADLKATLTAEPILSAIPAGVTLTGYAVDESQPEPILTPTAPTARATEAHRVDEFAWAAIANQSELETPKDRKVACWRLVACGAVGFDV
jgi:autotransporter-associated beta strand protein